MAKKTGKSRGLAGTRGFRDQFLRREQLDVARLLLYTGLEVMRDFRRGDMRYVGIVMIVFGVCAWPSAVLAERPLTEAEWAQLENLLTNFPIEHPMMTQTQKRDCVCPVPQDGNHTLVTDCKDPYNQCHTGFIGCEYRDSRTGRVYGVACYEA